MSRILQFTHQDMEILEKKPLYQGFFEMNQYTLRHRLFAGGWSEVFQREMFERGNAVAILPYDPQQQAFVMIEQFRFGAVESGQSPWLLEIVAGMHDKGLSLTETCHAEMREETGLTIKHLSPALDYLSSPGGTTERLYIYHAHVDSTQLQRICGLPDEHEDILVHQVPEAQAMEWLRSGQVDNAATVIALQHFALNKVEILAQWGIDAE